MQSTLLSAFSPFPRNLSVVSFLSSRIVQNPSQPFFCHHPGSGTVLKAGISELLHHSPERLSPPPRQSEPLAGLTTLRSGSSHAHDEGKCFHLTACLST